MHTGYVIKQALLALLSDRPTYGYQLKSSFEAATGTAWVLNIGQVYSTLGRMERDGLIVGLGEDDEGRPRYQLSAVGREELADWLATAVERSVATRDEVTMKVLMAAATDVVDPYEPIATQRAASLQILQEATLARNAASTVADRLHLERLIANTTAELRWLEVAEAELERPESRASLRLGDAATAATGATDTTGHRQTEAPIGQPHEGQNNG